MNDFEPRPPGKFAFTVGVIFPAAVILFELVTGLCAEIFFDPIPTPGHLILLLGVPLVNLLLWRAAAGKAEAPRWLAVAGGATAAIAGAYSLLFLPVLPFAFIGILLLGFGALPFAPVAAFVFSLRWTSRLADLRDGTWRRAAGGAALGMLLLALVDLPATATYVALQRYRGTADQREGAVSLMRTLGDRDMLLRLSYGDSGRATGILSFLASSWSDGPFGGGAWSRTADARELYYRVTGEAFNAVERPGAKRGDRMRPFAWDDDLGGTSVGGRVDGLALAGSRIDGSVAEKDNLAYLEWTLDVHNSTSVQREARLTMALPEGAVASRATLWVNGEPREASFAARSEARAAYNKVVSARRDPLLVTTDGAQRLLVQAFPIAPGSTIKLRIGMTAPFAIAPDGRRSLALPAIVERNFDLPPQVRHSVWIEGDAPLRSARQPLGQAVLRDEISDDMLVNQRNPVLLPPIGEPSVRYGGVAASGRKPTLSVRQTIARAPASKPSRLLLVFDSSAGNKEVREPFLAALDSLPRGLPVGLVVASEEPVSIAPEPWSSVQRRRFLSVLEETRFRGGQDNRAALAAALEQAADDEAVVLWIHGPQPVAFLRAEPRLEQPLERLEELPRLVRYQSRPGRALSIEGSRWFEDARFVNPTGRPADDLKAALSELSGMAPRWTVSREPASGDAVAGSSHIVRLWAADKIKAKPGARGAEREEALRLARRLNLITPISGAVVLETDNDYRANGLAVPSADEVPTVPEPGTWALIAIVLLAGFWLLRRQRPGFV